MSPALNEKAKSIVKTHGARFTESMNSIIHILKRITINNAHGKKKFHKKIDLSFKYLVMMTEKMHETKL